MSGTGDYISREAAIDIMCKILCDGRENCDENAYCCSAKLMESIHAADVRPVVLCKECKNYIKRSGACAYLVVGMREDGFCSYGEKREES